MHFLSDLLECNQFSIGELPITVTAFHDGTDALRLDWIERWVRYTEYRMGKKGSRRVDGSERYSKGQRLSS